MKIDKEMRLERMRYRYFEPPENVHTCKRCGSVTKLTKKQGRAGHAAPYWCRRHKFFVRKDGCCNDHSPDPFEPIQIQQSLGPIFEDAKDAAAATT